MFVFGWILQNVLVTVAVVAAVVVCFVSFFPPWICQSLVIHTISFAPLPRYRTIHFVACMYACICACICVRSLRFFLCMYDDRVICCDSNQYHFKIIHKLCVAIFLRGNARVLPIVSCTEEKKKCSKLPMYFVVFGALHVNRHGCMCVCVCVRTKRVFSLNQYKHASLVRVVIRKPMLAS